ncbi:MAG: hypothetical protein HY908_34145 [Myxococcales bacterium]|nr:hypothetical protein [Myxococcales bacterium]
MASRRSWLVALVALAVLAGGAAAAYALLGGAPAATTPAGAWAAVAYALGSGQPERVHDHLDAAGQDACAAIARDAARAVELVDAHYPEAERARARAPYADAARAGGPSALWLLRATSRGWLDILRSDLSGVAAVEESGERAIVTTARGSRHELARRPDGGWGLTAFSAELGRESERLARDLVLVARAAEDYARAGPP